MAHKDRLCGRGLVTRQPFRAIREFTWEGLLMQEQESLLPRWQSALRAAYAAGAQEESTHGLEPPASAPSATRESARLLAAYALLEAAQGLMTESEPPCDRWHH